MTLLLQGIALNDEALSRPLIGRFDERGGTLGRSDTATFTLPDPERLISRVQAQILHSDEGYWIENVSAANSTLHNGRPLSAGMRVLLRDSDEIRIGGYTLRAAFEDDEASATILRGRTQIIPGKNARDALQAAQSAAKPKPAVESTRETPREAVREAPRVPLRDPPPDPFSASQTLESPFVMPRDALAAAAAAAGAPGVGPDVSPPPTTPAPAPGAQSVSMSEEALWRAFVEGVGVELTLSKAPSPALMKSIGTMMRIAVEGIHRLVTMRSTAKDEMRAEMTMIQVRGNNSLKFAPDAAVALQLLLQPPARGFLSGADTLRETMIDLQSHQVGMTAGMRSALEAVLDRFEPGKVEAQLTKRSLLDALRPTHRKARLWELYLEHYRALREEAEQDFQRLFGEAFRAAYEAQVHSLEAAHQKSSADPKLRGGGP